MTLDARAPKPYGYAMPDDTDQAATKQFSIQLTPADVAAADAIKKSTGIQSLTERIRYALRQTAKREADAGRQ